MGYTNRQLQQGKDGRGGRDLITKSMNCLQRERERERERNDNGNKGPAAEAISNVYVYSIHVCVYVYVLCLCVSLCVQCVKSPWAFMTCINS
jgi:hypothetical protein